VGLLCLSHHEYSRQQTFTHSSLIRFIISYVEILPYKKAFRLLFWHHSAALTIGASTVTYDTTFSSLTSLLQPKLVQYIRQKLRKVFANGMRKSMLTGEIPHNWRDAKTVPIYKNGNRSKLENYRPVSLWVPQVSVIGPLLL